MKKIVLNNKISAIHQLENFLEELENENIISKANTAAVRLVTTKIFQVLKEMEVDTEYVYQFNPSEEGLKLLTSIYTDQGSEESLSTEMESLVKEMSESGFFNEFTVKPDELDFCFLFNEYGMPSRLVKDRLNVLKNYFQPAIKVQNDSKI